MRLNWNAELVTGVRQIDLQHQELIELINELESAHERGQDDLALADVLPRLTSYALFHFCTEEGLMAKVAMNTSYAPTPFERTSAVCRQGGSNEGCVWRNLSPNRGAVVGLPDVMAV
jgi:hypothetical protein